MSLVMAEDFKDTDKMAKCYKCGEAITGKQYRAGNYHYDRTWGGGADAHRRCPKGARMRAMIRTLQAVKEKEEKEKKEALAELARKFTFIAGHGFKHKRRKPKVGEIIDEGQEYVIDSVEEITLIMTLNDPKIIRQEILNFCKRHVHYDTDINQQVSNVWVNWQKTSYSIERKFDIKNWRLLPGWNVLALAGDNRYHYCPMEKFVDDPEFD
jgi:hypothetical protein